MTPFFDERRFQTVSCVTVAALYDEAASDNVVDYGATDSYPYVIEPNTILPVALRLTSATFTIDADVNENGGRSLLHHTT